MRMAATAPSESCLAAWLGGVQGRETGAHLQLGWPAAVAFRLTKCWHAVALPCPLRRERKEKRHKKEKKEKKDKKEKRHKRDKKVGGRCESRGAVG